MHALPEPDDAAINVQNPLAWVEDAFHKAQELSYAAPVTPDTPEKVDFDAACIPPIFSQPWAAVGA